MGLLKTFLRAIVAMLMVATGLLVTVALAVVATIFFLIRRPRAPVGHIPGKGGRAFPRPADDVIDITATEVSAERGKTA